MNDALFRATDVQAPTPSAAYAAFAAFGVFWGAWGAALPMLRSQAGVSEAQLGTALLCIGAGALPAMLASGRLIDRVGLRLTAPLLTGLGAAGVVVAAGARGSVLLCACMLVVGATSGAADVAINTLAGRTERATSRPLLTRAHGVFSAAVVVSSLATGALLSTGLGLVGAFAVVTAGMVALSTAVVAGTTAARGRPWQVPQPAVASPIPGEGPRRWVLSPLVVVGLVGALACATENAHQSWGAVLLVESFDASPQVAAAAPATFAATAAVTRLLVAPLSRSHPTALLGVGGAVAALGSTTLALAPTVPVALLGLAVTALGTAPLFPTLLSRAVRDVAPDLQGRSTSTITTTAYLGFLLGPAYVGLLAGATTLRVAVLGIAVLALAFAVAAAPFSRWATRSNSTTS